MNPWIQAARPLAHANIAVPILYGQALAFAIAGEFRWQNLLWAHTFGLFNHLFIVFTNDLADESADRLHSAPTAISGGSRVLQEGKLTRSQLRTGAAVAAVGMVLSGSKSTTTIALTLCAFLLLWAYSFPPVRLSYRGYGEWLQGIGVGLVLPLMGFAMQTEARSWMLLLTCLPTVVLGIASNICTSLPDAEADQKANKRTLPVRRSELRARVTCLVLVFLPLMTPAIQHGRIGRTGFVYTSVVAGALWALSLFFVRRADARNRKYCMRFATLNLAAINTMIIGWSLTAVHSRLLLS